MVRKKGRWIISLLVITATVGLASSLPAGYGDGASSGSVWIADAALTAEEVRLGAVVRVDSTTVVLTNDQHEFRFDGESTQAFVTCEVTIHGASAATAGLQGPLEHARITPEADSGTGHLAYHPEHSLELMAEAVNPIAMENMSATWKGTMIGANVGDAVTRSQFVVGDVTLTIDDLINPDVDVAFSNVHDLETGTKLDSRHVPYWENIPLDGIAFGEKPVGNTDYIRGQFVGEDHAAVVGIFELNDIVGSFGANRMPDGE